MAKTLIQPRPLTGDRILTEAEAGKLLGYADGSLPVMRIRNPASVPPFYRLGRAIRYRESDIIAFLEARRVEPQPIGA